MQEFGLSNAAQRKRTARYLKLQVDSFHGSGGSLQYFSYDGCPVNISDVGQYALFMNEAYIIY